MSYISEACRLAPRAAKRGYYFRWSERRVDILKTLWDKKWTARRISVELGGVSTSAVLRKARSLGLRRRYKINYGNTSAVVAELRAIRMQAKLTSVEVSERMRRHPEMIYAWERGKNDPHLRNLENWCHALGVKIVLVPCVDSGAGEGCVET